MIGSEGLVGHSHFGRFLARYGWLFSLALVVGWAIVRYANSSPAYAAQISNQGVNVAGFSARGEEFEAVGEAHSHVISVGLPIKPGYRYVYAFNVSALPPESIVLHVDLFGPGYDDPSAERAESVGVEQEHSLLQGSLLSGGNPPVGSSLRIFYDGPSGLHITRIAIGEISPWRSWLERFLAVLALASLFVVGVITTRRMLGKGDSDSAPIPWSSLVALFFVLMSVRFGIAMMLPYWSGDEYAYKQIASSIWFGQFKALADAQVGQPINVPNLLYPYFISPAFALGDAFYTGVRFLNAVAISLSLFPAFAITKRVTGSNAMAFVIGIFAVAMPSANIGAFAVTEVLFHPAMLCAIWLTMLCVESPASATKNLWLAIVAGVAINIRVPGVIILPAFYIALLLSHAGELRRLLVRPVWLGVAPVAICVAAIIKKVLAASAIGGLGIYENHSGGWMSQGLQTLIHDPSGAVALLVGHFSLLAIPYSIGIACVLAGAIDKTHSDVSRRRDAFVLGMMFLGAFALTLLFTLAVSSNDLGGLERWHGRYYFSTLPPLLAYAFYMVKARPESRLSAITFYLVLTSVLLGALWFGIAQDGLHKTWFGSTVDGMEVQWAIARPALFVCMLLVTMGIAIFVWRTGDRALLVMMLAGFLIIGNAGSLFVLAQPPAGSKRKCGEFVAEYLEQSPGSFKILYRTRGDLVDLAFWIPSMPTAVIQIPDGTTEYNMDAGPKADYLITEVPVSIMNAATKTSSGACQIYGRAR